MTIYLLAHLLGQKDQEDGWLGGRRLMASQKVHLRRCASPSSLQRTLVSTLTPQVLGALHLDLLLRHPNFDFYEIINHSL
jgi:hypothetical protein